MKTHEESIAVLRKHIDSFPDLLVMLGSGWKSVLEVAKIETEISYEELFDVKALVPGHDGKLVIATVGDRRVAFMAGRFHMYEGFSAREATMPIRVFAEAGLQKLVVTAACGALNEKYRVGDFCLTSDLLTLFLALDNPLVGPQFLDVSEVFDPEMCSVARKVMVEQGISFHEGVYTYYHGPNFETPADKMALKFLGGDVVGMSTVPETLMARWLGMQVMSLAFITNLAFVKHDHHEVIAEAEKAAGKMSILLEAVMEQL